MKFAIGFVAGVVTTAALLTIAFLIELEERAPARIATPWEDPDEPEPLGV